jgi:hypothetical protein
MQSFLLADQQVLTVRMVTSFFFSTKQHMPESSAGGGVASRLLSTAHYIVPSETSCSAQDEDDRELEPFIRSACCREAGPRFILSSFVSLGAGDGVKWVRHCWMGATMLTKPKLFVLRTVWEK